MKFLLIFFLALFFVYAPLVDAGRGCCSYHGGQSYCDTSVGRWVCNDGTYSPTCGCIIISDPPPPIIPKWVQPTEIPTPEPTQPVLSDQTSNDKFRLVAVFLLVLGGGVGYLIWKDQRKP